MFSGEYPVIGLFGIGTGDSFSDVCSLFWKRVCLPRVDGSRVGRLERASGVRGRGTRRLCGL